MFFKYLEIQGLLFAGMDSALGFWIGNLADLNIGPGLILRAEMLLFHKLAGAWRGRLTWVGLLGSVPLSIYKG